MRTRIRLIVAAVVAALMGTLLTVAPATSGADRAVAAEAADFDPGFLVSDQQFYDGGAMTAAQVQAFIDAKHPGCDDGYTCLDSYAQRTPTMAADAYCESLTGRSSETAASIIASVGAACDISQRYLLVLLQKEQSLVTLRNPTTIRYERATGFGCPDTAPCDSSVGGFFYQVYYAARQFNRYAAHPANYRHRAGQTNQVLFNPNEACGSSPVFIQNLATAGLYNYTPYQPNAAALANLYGSGDTCSAYGNRNTWRIWTDWFGDPTITLPTATRVSGADRYATAVQVSRRTFATTAPVVYLASGQDFPDGLAAGPAAAHEGGPVLLTPQGSIPQAVLDEIRRLRPAKVVIVGAEPSVSAAVQAAVQALDPNREVVRLGGVNRYETSRLIAEHAFDAAASAFVATGIRFPDALAAGPAAALRDGPVLLVDGRAAHVDAATLATLQDLGVGWAGVVGDASSVSQGIAAGIGAAGLTVQRYAGSDRYATAVQLSRLFSDVSAAYVASGTGFPDALAGAAAAGATGAPLLLTGPSCMPATTRSALIAFMPDDVLVLGGTPTISEASAQYTSC
ncbi:cell wall-binding repeat-containing protein [Agrococcus sp. SCSIO52902]|uniref:cell wall-binding repeat-containing protein n=1 Tax=Agrococcus sp. SCSIO52902 TaxID=2933290 RepID=UPI001FF4ACA0|nr:cell wall-binding repeat-containing protein [Agrococcus sp. SCSIO52902]UOW01518.1 cell wall-binding repeat-containing protein [Agrococcus sp. SCSIO52902]